MARKPILHPCGNALRGARGRAPLAQILPRGLTGTHGSSRRWSTACLTKQFRPTARGLAPISWESVELRRDRRAVGPRGQGAARDRRRRRGQGRPSAAEQPTFVIFYYGVLRPVHRREFQPLYSLDEIEDRYATAAPDHGDARSGDDLREGRGNAAAGALDKAVVASFPPCCPP